MSPSTHEGARENAVWLLYQLDAGMGAPLHELVIEHVLLITALLAQEHDRVDCCASAVEKETHSEGRESAQQAELALVPQLGRSLVLTYE